jgi:ERCC4-type nuclease
MTQIELLIDTRENALISNLTDYNFSKEQLDLGDIIFKENDEIILIIERKTLPDLKASICDGRLKEQKARLLGSSINIMYIIEGDFTDAKIGSFPKNTLIGSIINMELRDNIRVHRTMCIQETADFIKKLHDKLIKDGKMFFKDQKVNYSSNIKHKKKDNMTPDVWFKVSLQNIPQVSDKISEVIIEKYKTFSNLLNIYNTIPEELREKLLADLEYSIANDKKRKIGIKISSRIYNFLYGFI